jgi:hypothetical protein
VLRGGENMCEVVTMKVSKELLEELRKEKEETKVPMIFILEKAWEEYKKSKEETK